MYFTKKVITKGKRVYLHYENLFTLFHSIRMRQSTKGK